MSEKEFLIAYCKYVVGNRHEDSERIMNGHNKLIDQFLETHHKEYFEVEFVKKDEQDKEFDRQWNKEFGPDLVVTDNEGKAMGVLTEGVNTLYDADGKVIGWSSLTPEQLRELYNTAVR